MDIAGEITSALGLDKKGEITPLQIHSWIDPERKGNAKPEDIYTAFINPDEYTLNYNVIGDPQGAVGDITKRGIFLGSSLEVTLKFFIDGTNASGKSIIVPGKNAPNVADNIQHFNKVVGYDGQAHGARFLRLIWGESAWMRDAQYAFDCILKNASIQYKLFTNTGNPLRAIITATFAEALSYTKQEAEKKDKSADLTHVRIVKEGDTLPGLAQEVYNDFSYYLKVAEINNIKNFRDLQPGMKIFFPPIDKTVNKKANA